MVEVEPPYGGDEVDALKEACGVAGIIAFDQEHSVGRIACAVVRELQHRGEDAAGVIIGDGETDQFDFVGIKNEGLVSEVFPDGAASLDKWNPTASTGVAHVRYGTSAKGVDGFSLAQPFLAGGTNGPGVVVAHNGHIEGMHTVASQYGVDLFGCGGDSEALTRTIAHLAQEDMTGSVLGAMHEVLPRLDGGFSLVVAEKGRLHAARDPWGTRPLALGYLASGAYVVASETSALAAAGPVINDREVEAGEIVSIDHEGNVELSQIQRVVTFGGPCALEYAYLAREDTILGGQRIYDSRAEIGRILAQEQPADVDVVIGIPNSGLVAAMGYAEELDVPYKIGFFRDVYSSRSFIQADQELRRQMVLRKLRVNPSVVAGKRVGVVDDSVVRGTSIGVFRDALHEAGASEVHMRVASPPNRWPCFAGIATGKQETLLANRYPEVEDMRQHLRLDSLGFISVNGLAMAVNKTSDSLCMACMTNQYPYPVPGSEGKRSLPLTVVAAS